MHYLFWRVLIIAVISFVSILSGEEWALKIIAYDRFIQDEKEALQILQTALFQDGIVGIRGIPGYAKKVARFLNQARAFSVLPEEVKERYAPNREKGDLFLGYERGKEKFQQPDGKWVVDDLKVSYYAFVPDNPCNRWPVETELQAAYLKLGTLMSVMGKMVMEKISLIGPSTGIFLKDLPQVGRMLHYQKSKDSNLENPYWCGSHFDHGLFTVLTPAAYFVEEKEIPEPEKAGLFVKIDNEFKKVVADPEVMLFQVGEFAQLVMNDAIRATEHRVDKAPDFVERYALVLFFNAPMETIIHSTSALTRDARYGDPATPCSYQRWHEESFKRYLVK